MAASVAHHENIRRGDLDRTSTSLHVVGRAGRGGERKERSASDMVLYARLTSALCFFIAAAAAELIIDVRA